MLCKQIEFLCFKNKYIKKVMNKEEFVFFGFGLIKITKNPQNCYQIFFMVHYTLITPRAYHK